MHRAVRLGSAILATGMLIAVGSGAGVCAEARASGETVIVERDVAVPMRDGVVLRADVHRPAVGGPYPVLVLRTPYGKTGDFDRFVQAGYIVVSQDARGRYASDGTWESFLRHETHDAVDGYDTVEWAAKLAGSSGKVGTFGSSYDAFLQWRLAPLRPPSLVAMAAYSIPARYTDLEGPGTIRPGRRLHWWAVQMAPDMRRRAGAPRPWTQEAAQKEWNEGDAERWIGFLPLIDLPREILGHELEAVRAWLEEPWRDPWKLDEAVDQIVVPNLNITGWWDHCNGDMVLDRAIRAEAASEVARKGSRTIIGPWGHDRIGMRSYGNIDFGADAALDIAAHLIRWFDYWLKGEPTGIDETASYRIFVMGENRWRDEPDWPLPSHSGTDDRVQERTLYLTSGGRANTPAGNGRLEGERPPRGGIDEYTYDPEDPAPSLYRPRLIQIPTDQRPLRRRQDILVYQTEPLTERVEVTGSPVVELFAASSAPDTDFFARLIDVHPNGVARDVSLGMVRARYRNGLQSPGLIEPGEVVKYTIRLNPTSNAFLPGHRIRLDITSSDFPNYDRNHNTTADQNADAKLVSAAQTIHHGGAHATRILLPEVRDR